MVKNCTFVPMELRRLFKYLGAYSGRMNFTILISIINKIVDMMPPIMIGWLIDSVNGNTPGWIAAYFNISTPLSIGLFFGFLIVIVFSVESFTEWLMKLGFMRLAQRVHSAD